MAGPAAVHAVGRDDRLVVELEAVVFERALQRCSHWISPVWRASASSRAE